MFSKRTWFAIAGLFLVWAVWHSTGSVEYVYSERWTEDGALRQSKVVCGSAPAIVFLGDYSGDVPGPNTADDCDRAARTRLLEVGLLGLAAGVAVFVGIRFGADPPAPIDRELKPLPKGERVVEGRRPREP